MNKMTMTTVVLVIVALIVGGVAGFMVERTRATDKMEAYKMTMQKQMDDSMKMTSDMTPTSAMSDVVMMAKGSGVLTDAKGMTLYTYDKDTKNVSNCTGQCLTYWPPFLTSGQAPSGLPTNLGTLKRSDGSTQYTWNSMPLYYYSADKKAGDTTGNGIGGIWHVIK